MAGLRDWTSVSNPLRFQGQYFDRESGLHYHRHRYYDPDNGAAWRGGQDQRLSVSAQPHGAGLQAGESRSRRDQAINSIATTNNPAPNNRHNGE